MAYGVAFLAVLAAGTVYVLVSAIPRSGWDPVRLAHEAAKFAFSAPGLLGVALVSAGAIIAIVVVAASASSGSGNNAQPNQQNVAVTTSS